MRSLVCMPLLLFALPAASQQSSHACASVVEPAARLACYDKAFPLPEHMAQLVEDKAKDDFGLSGPGESLGQAPGYAGPGSIESRLAKVDQERGTQRVFHLENGQVWMRAQTGSNGHVKVGDLVQVRKGLMAGYVLVTPNGVHLRVRRVH